MVTTIGIHDIPGTNEAPLNAHVRFSFSAVAPERKGAHRYHTFKRRGVTPTGTHAMKQSSIIQYESLLVASPPSLLSSRFWSDL